MTSATRSLVPDPILDEIPQDDKPRGVVLPVTDKAILIRLLTREEEETVAQARLPGQGRRETLQCMREAKDAYETPEHTQTNATDPSAFADQSRTKLNRYRAAEKLSRNSARTMITQPRAKLTLEALCNRHRMKLEWTLGGRIPRTNDQLQ